MFRALALALVACGGSPPPAAAQHPIANHVVPPAPDDPGDCEDIVQGPLYAPVVRYLMSMNEVAARTIRDHRGEFLQCYTRRAVHDPRLEGKVTVAFTVEKGGRAGKVRTVGFDDAIDRCICERIRNLQFDEGIAGTRVEYPFLFKPGA